MITKMAKKHVAFRWSLVSITIFAIGLIGSSAFAAEAISFKGTTKKIASRDFVTLTGKLTKPQGDGPFPAVVLMHGCSGIEKYNDTWAERLATWGYVALQVDSLGPRDQKEVCTNLLGVHFQVRAQDAYDAKTYLGGLPFVDRNRIAIMGWSHGGITTLCSVSASNWAAWAVLVKTGLSRKNIDPFRAAIAFYPYCIETLRDSNAPLLILAGELDNWCPAALCQDNMPRRKTQNEVILKIYPGAYHCFDWEGVDLTTPEGRRVLYNKEALADSIVQVREFLAKHLK
jgi:dienelactone hydrolase